MKCKQGLTALAYAIIGNKYEAAQILAPVECGESLDNGLTALIKAIQLHRNDMLHLLLKEKEMMIKGMSALMFACTWKNLKAVEVL